MARAIVSTQLAASAALTISLLRDALLEAGIVCGNATELQALKEPDRTAQALSDLWVQMTDSACADGSGPSISIL